MWLPDNDIEDIDAYLEEVRRRQAELDTQPTYPEVEAPVFNGWEPAPYQPPPPAYQPQPTSAADWQVPDWMANDQPPADKWTQPEQDWWRTPYSLSGMPARTPDWGPGPVDAEGFPDWMPTDTESFGPSNENGTPYNPWARITNGFGREPYSAAGEIPNQYSAGDPTKDELTRWNNNWLHTDPSFSGIRDPDNPDNWAIPPGQQFLPHEASQRALRVLMDKYHFSPDQAQQFRDNVHVNLMPDRTFGGGFYNTATRTTYSDALNDEALLHELSHASWDSRRKANVPGLIDAMIRLSGDDDPRYATARGLAREYLQELRDPANPTGYNDHEVYAGLASGVMGDLGKLPEYIRPFFAGEFIDPNAGGRAFTDPNASIRMVGPGNPTWAGQPQPTSAADWQVPDWMANDQPPEPGWQSPPADWWQPQPVSEDTINTWRPPDAWLPNYTKPGTFGPSDDPKIQWLRDNPYEAGQLGLPAWRDWTDYEGQQALAGNYQAPPTPWGDKGVTPGSALGAVGQAAFPLMSLNESVKQFSGGRWSLDPVYDQAARLPGGRFAADVVDAFGSPLSLATMGLGGGMGALAGNAAKNLGATVAGLGTDRALSAYGETDNPGADLAGNPWVRGLAGLGAGVAGYEGTLPLARGAKAAGGEIGAALRDLPENLVDINTARPRWTPGFNRLQAGALDPETGLPMEFQPVSGGAEIPRNLPDGRLNPDWLESRKLDKGDMVTADDGRTLRVAKDYDPTPGAPGAKGRLTLKDPETGETVRLPRDKVDPVVPTSPPETTTAAKAMEATPAAGITSGEDLVEKGWKQKILDLLDTEQRHRDAGLVDAEIRQKRLDQLQGMQERRAQATEMGLTGTERADFIRGGARVGRATAPELALSDVDKANLFNHVIDNTQGFEYLQAGTAVSKMINGERLHQGEINIIRRTLGDEVADQLVARAKPTKGFDALDQAEIVASRKYSEEALARQAKQPQFEPWSEQDLRLKRAYEAQNAAEDARRAANNLKPVNHAPFSRDIATNMARREAEAADQAAKVAAEKAQAAAERATRNAQAAAERAAAKDTELRATTGQRNQEGVARQQKIAREAANKAQADAAAVQEAADRQAMKARWKAIGKQNDMDEATLARIASPTGMTPEERALAQQARWTQLNRAQREAGDLSAALQRTASRESELGRARQMEDLVRKAAGDLPSGAEEQVRRTISSWTGRTREILDAVDAPSQRSLIGLVQSAGDILDAAGRWVGGDVPDSFLSHLLHQRNYLTRSLEQQGMDPEIAGALGRKAEQMFLARKYPNGVPEHISEQIARTRYNPASKAQIASAGVAEVSQVAKNSMFGIGDIAVFGVNGLKAGSTSGPAIATGIVNRLLNTLHLGVDTTGALPRRIAYQLDGVIQGGAGQGVSDFAHDHSVLSLIGRPGRFVDTRAYEPAVRRLTEFQYDTVMGSLRNLIHEGNLTIAHLAGEDISSAVARNRLAAFANSATGAAEHALTRNRANVERALLMSPSLRRAQVNQIRAVAQAMLTGTPQEKLVAASVLFSTGIYTLAMGKYLNDHFGLGDFEMDPSKPGFGFITVPNPRGGRAVSVDVFPQEQVLKYFSQAGRALAEGDPEDARTALTKLGISSASWPVQLGLKAVGLGFDPTSGGYRLGDYGKDLSPGRKVFNILPLPPVVSDLISGKFTAATGALGVVGLNSYEVSPYTDRQQWAQATYGKPWGLLTNEQRRLVPPDIKQATDTAFAERNPEKAAATDAEKEARGRIEQRYREGLTTAFARYDQADKGDPATLKRAADDLRDGIDNLANVRRAALGEHPFFDNPNATPQDQAVSQWFDTYDLRDPVTGKLNREQMEQAQIELLQKWDDDTRNYVLRMAMGEKTPFGEFEELRKGAVRTGLGGYYDDLKKIAESGFYDAKSRTQFRIDHPETDALLRKWDVSGSTAKAADAIQEAYAFQAKDDERLKAQGITYAKEWRDNYQDRARQLGAKLDMAFADNPQSAPRTAGEGLLREFNQKYDSLIDPSTGKLLPGGVDAEGTYRPGGREQIDSWLASRPDVQAAMDARDKRAVTPMVTQYRQDVKTIVNSQYWDVKDMVAAAYTAAKWGTGTKYTSFDMLESELLAAARVEARKLIPKDPEAADAFAQQIVDKVLQPMTDLSSRVSKALRESDDDLMTALIRWGYYNPSKAVVGARIKAAPLR